MALSISGMPGRGGSFADDGPGEPSETSTGVDNGSSIVGQNPSIALVLATTPEEQAPQATLNVPSQDQTGPPRGLRAHITVRTKRAAHKTQRQRVWPSRAPAPASPGL